MSITFFLLSSIPKGQFPKLVHVVAKQDCGIYSKSTEVTCSKNETFRSVLKTTRGSLMDFIIRELQRKLNVRGWGHGQMAPATSTGPWSPETLVVFGFLLKGKQEWKGEILYSTSMWHFCLSCQRTVCISEHRTSPGCWGVGGCWE